MSESASTDRRAATQRRITREAQRLADERGFDGFTMDDLAAASDVSRRTLFNYFPGKLDAVLGPALELPEETMAAFRAGGPHGDLVLDLGTVAHALFDQEVTDRDDFARAHRVMQQPRVLAAAHERFGDLTSLLVHEISRREGPAFDARRGRIAIAVLGALFETALDRFIDDPDQPSLADAFDHALQHARDLLARPQEY